MQLGVDVDDDAEQPRQRFLLVRFDVQLHLLQLLSGVRLDLLLLIIFRTQQLQKVKAYDSI